MKGRASDSDVSVIGLSAYDDDIDSAGEGRWIDVLVVLVWRADGADRAAQVVHGRTREEGSGNETINITLDPTPAMTAVLG